MTWHLRSIVNSIEQLFPFEEGIRLAKFMSKLRNQVMKYAKWYTKPATVSVSPVDN